MVSATGERSEWKSKFKQRLNQETGYLDILTFTLVSSHLSLSYNSEHVLIALSSKSSFIGGLHVTS